MHLAAAVKTKCVSIFIKTDPQQIGPMPLKNHIIIQKPNSAEISAKEIINALAGGIL
jgi:ADP-heptose:LPS heptosyltransferase